MQEGFELMIIGMGVVFAFLSLMVVIMYGTAALFERFGDTPVEAEDEEQPDTDLSEIVAAIAVAHARAHS